MTEPGHGFARELRVVEAFEHPVPLPPHREVPPRPEPEAHRAPAGEGTVGTLLRLREQGWSLFLLVSGLLAALIVVAVLVGIARLVVPRALGLS